MLDDEQLLKSDIVANSQMNRERQLIGPNSYAKELGFDPLQFLAAAGRAGEKTRWLDLCCGSAQALVDAGRRIEQDQLLIEIVGVDLVDMFASGAREVPGLSLVVAPLNRWEPPGQFDLITCVHGLHYLGDKLGLVERASGWLKAEGRFLGHLDFANLCAQDGNPLGRQLLSSLRRQGVRFSIRTHRLEMGGGTAIRLPYRYLGANDQVGPNYTGQDVVESFYEEVITNFTE